MVLDEVDAAAAKMPSSGKKKAAKEEVATSKAAAPQKSALLEQSKQWWERASSLAPTEMESSIVSCRLSDGTHFMSKDDCLSQGGVPSDRS
jgi:hypothetical protein